MCVLAVDPSFRNTGWAIVDGLTVVAAGVISTKKAKKGYVGEDNHNCSVQISAALANIIDTWKPTEIVAEAQAGSKSSKAAQLMGMGWGVLSAVSERFGLSVTQVRPQQIKKYLTGDKSATKEEIAEVVCSFFPDAEAVIVDNITRSKREHAYDALSVYLTCFGEEMTKNKQLTVPTCASCKESVLKCKCKDRKLEK